MAMKALKDGLVDELRDMLSAEQQITKALPKVIKKASSTDLKKALESHLEETNQHVSRLKEALSSLGASERSKTCDGMKGILEENEDVLDKGEADIVDALAVAGCQKVEHYEIASYGTIITWAETLGENGIVKLLAQTLNEEKAADEKLTKIAATVNREAVATVA